MLSYIVGANLLISIFYCTFVESNEIHVITSGKIYASVGKNLKLDCVDLGREYYDLAWFDANKNEIAAKENSSRVISITTNNWGYPGVILSFEPFMAEDSSNYSCCRKWNNSTCGNDTAELIVNRTGGYPPRFVLEYVSLQFVEGKDALLRCSADGQPTPEYTWLDMYGRNMYNEIGNWNMSSKEGWLLLYSVNKSQEGIYTCVARNIHGSASKLYMVNVSRGRAPWFHRKIEYHEFSVGSDVSLECRAEGEPSPFYTWYDNNGRNMHYYFRNWNASTNGLLEIYSIRAAQEGNYTCIASNEHGNASKLFEVIVRVNETSVVVKQLWQTLVVFGLKNKAELLEQGFRFVKTTFQDSSIFSSIVWLIGERLIVRDLKPGRTYVFEFYATKTRSGLEYPLNNLILNLPPFSPLIVVNQVKDTTVKVKFPYQSLDEISGTLKPEYFLLRYVKLEQISGSFYESDCPIEMQIPYCFGRGYEIGGLLPKSYYKIQLSSMLKDGLSEKSEIIVSL